MDIGFEQLIWVIVLLIFVVASALKSLRKKRPEAKPAPAREKEVRRTSFSPPKEKPKSNEELRRFLEELMGIERPKEEPPVRHETEETAPPVVLKQPKKRPKPKTIIEEEPQEVTKGTLVQLEGLKAQSLPEVSKPLEHPIVPPKNELKRAIILSEIIGPPISKRKTHRLF
ncbi:MAG TPA: hypothetical protein ACFYD6_11295 [Candidatus Brocadiia bacterium]|nr:hypothetical protein [Candidatus Brocadiales bacterium]